ncbi:MAG: hypothetical protein NTV55_08535 [Planctomycetota bacterium]|nr:hypothetical protein [Planctomycetota bacterium]
MLFRQHNRPLCPLCHSTRVQVSASQPGDLLARLFFRHLVRCRACSHRFATWYKVSPGDGDHFSTQSTTPR